MEDPIFVDVDGIRTAYYEAGRGRPVVLIHGGGFGSLYNAYHWSLNFGPLAKRFHVLAPDKLGQGLTDNPESESHYTMSQTIRHLVGFLWSAGVQRAVLVGHSRGALPAARIAIDYPELVSHLVLFDTNTLAPDHPSTPRDFYLRLEDPGEPADTEEYVRREPLANSYTSDHITTDFVERMRRLARMPKILEARERLRALRTTQFLPDVREQKYQTLDAVRDGRLGVPTLVIWGLNDLSAPIVLGYELYHRIAEAVDDAQLHVLNHAGHYVYREHADAVNRLIAQFIEGRPNGASVAPG